MVGYELEVVRYGLEVVGDGGVRTRGGGVRTRGGHIYDDPHFLIDDASLDFPSSLPLQHTAFTFSTLIDQSLPHSSIPSINEGVIHEDVGTSFIQELLHSYIDGPSFHILINTFLHHLLNNKERIRFKINDMDEEEAEAEEMEQH
ncbi:hypothetical protein AAG906_008003 [Vitis piasezkii]